MSSSNLSLIAERKGLALAALAKKRRVAAVTTIASAYLVIQFFYLFILQTSAAGLVVPLLIFLICASAACWLVATTANMALKNGYKHRARLITRMSMRLNLALYPFSNLGMMTAVHVQLQLLSTDSRFVEVEALSKMLIVANSAFPSLSRPSVDAMLRNFQATACMGQSRYSEASALFKECLASNRNFVSQTVLLHNIGACELSSENFQDSYTFFKLSAENARIHKHEELLLGTIYPSWARACIKLGSLDEAVQLLQSAKSLADLPGTEPYHRANYYRAYGELRMAQGAWEEAEQHLESAIELMRTSLDETHPSLNATMKSLAEVFERLGAISRAEEIRNQVTMNEEIFKKHIEIAEQLLIDTAPGDYLYQIGTS